MFSMFTPKWGPYMRGNTKEDWKAMNEGCVNSVLFTDGNHMFWGASQLREKSIQPFSIQEPSYVPIVERTDWLEIERLMKRDAMIGTALLLGIFIAAAWVLWSVIA